MQSPAAVSLKDRMARQRRPRGGGIPLPGMSVRRRASGGSVLDLRVAAHRRLVDLGYGGGGQARARRPGASDDVGDEEAPAG